MLKVVMETSLQTTVGPLWPDRTLENGKEAPVSSDASNALETMVDAIGQIGTLLTTAVPEREGTKDGNWQTLLDPNGAPRLSPPDDTPAMPVAAPTPYNIGALVSRVQTLRNEANGAVLNPNSTKLYEQMKTGIDKFVNAQLDSLKEFKEKAAALAEKAGRWYNRFATWASETMGPYMPYIGFAVAAIATVATGGAAWPMLAMAGVGLANHVLKEQGIDVCGAVAKAIKDVQGVGKGGSSVLADAVTSVMGLVLGDAEPMANLFGSIAKAVGADKATVEKWKNWGRLVGIAAGVGVQLLATWGGGIAGSVSSFASSAGGAVGSATAQLTGAVSQGLSKVVKAIEPYVTGLVKILRESAARLNDLARLFKEAMEACKGGLAAAMKSGPGAVRSNIAAWQPRINVAAKVGQTGVIGTNGLIGGTNGYREYDLAGAQYNVDVASAHRQKADKLLGIARDERRVVDEGLQRTLKSVEQNLKATTDMLRAYTSALLERGAIQSDAMTA
ncbi:hypothetical protein [Bordetella bronchialis]|uniref:hypothetical protein n=2 Tax=Bordetella bronchialis TaxID=463025 RepID=UPI0012EA3BB4|nr:hypothetical protein [Bordetella bronchialis]